MIIEKIHAALCATEDPILKQELRPNQTLPKIELLPEGVVDVIFSYPIQKQKDVLQSAVAAVAPGYTIRLSSNIIPRAIRAGLRRLPDVKNIIAFASGKGGVGKSTTAVNVAIALQQMGASVGIVDADIYGPSIPTLLALSGPPKTLDKKHMLPLSAYGLQVNSIGFLVEANSPIIWRGPIATRALEQLLQQTQWQKLDYLIVDMPAGTGDIPLTLAQRLPLTAVCLVTTPQMLAGVDAIRGLEMFLKVGVPVLGLVENMSHYVCQHCGEQQKLFPTTGCEKIFADYQLQSFGRVPLDIATAKQSDLGHPIATKNSASADLYQDIAIKIAAALTALPKDRSGGLPRVTVSSEKP